MRSPRITPIGSSSSTTAESRRADALRALALEFGFDNCSLAPISLDETERAAFLQWCESGAAAGMAYMTRDPQARLNPASWFPDVRSVLTVAVSYFQGPLPPKPGPAFGRVARYAWGLDYHPLILDRLEKLLTRLPEVLGAVSGRAAIDTRPLLERALARSAGLGFTGKNTVMIVPRSGAMKFHVGSFLFLGEILLDVDAGAPVEKPAGGCGSCRRCLDACPTHAFDGEYRLNANRCISYLTIENKGWIPREFRASLGDWMFGCDICQDVCPFNARAFETRWPELKSDRGVGPWVSLRELFSLDAAGFKARFGATPFQRAKRRGVLRNAAIVAGNSGDESLIPALDSLTSDGEPLARGHALAALSRLSPARARQCADKLRLDVDADVRAEALWTLEHVA